MELAHHIERFTGLEGRLVTGVSSLKRDNLVRGQRVGIVDLSVLILMAITE